MSTTPIIFQVRQERNYESDFHQVHQVVLRAFSGDGGGDGEARLVDAIRKNVDNCHIPELSLVATTVDINEQHRGEGPIVGHVMFSRISIRRGSSSATCSAAVPCLALAPVSVDPQYQKQGVGSMLIRHGIELARTMGHKIIVVLGSPTYYSRFGFETARPKGILCPYQVPDEYFMVLGLTSDAFDPIRETLSEEEHELWMVTYSSAFQGL